MLGSFWKEAEWYKFPNIIFNYSGKSCSGFYSRTATPFPSLPKHKDTKLVVLSFVVLAAKAKPTRTCTSAQ